MNKVPVTLGFDNRREVGEAELIVKDNGDITTKCNITDPDIAKLLKDGTVKPAIGYSSKHEKDGTMTMHITEVSLTAFHKDNYPTDEDLEAMNKRLYESSRGN